MLHLFLRTRQINFGSIPTTMYLLHSSTINKLNAVHRSQNFKWFKMFFLSLQSKLLTFNVKKCLSMSGHFKFLKNQLLVWLQMIIKVMLVPDLLLRESHTFLGDGTENRFLFFPTMLIFSDNLFRNMSTFPALITLFPIFSLFPQ